ncbi:conserved hypothetical protein [Planktothrix serta PCC 8927]|uniref:Uncharacterized protein n=1 Tax=Planktothrix serta PCC 8927 TaxID=671068 RepID=A0A7Z9BWG6_9CYAN|nr:conserved hypothetical protein [Planktothrix serta PCC 8927]
MYSNIETLASIIVEISYNPYQGLKQKIWEKRHGWRFRLKSAIIPIRD